MAQIYILLFIGVVLANLILYGFLFILARPVVARLPTRIAPNKTARWLRNCMSAGLVLVFGFVLPLGLNQLHHYERSEMVVTDRPLVGSLVPVRTLALLTDLPEDKNWADRTECGPRRCRSLLYHHAVDAFLTALPPRFGAALDPNMPVTRYRLDHRAWCPPIEHMDERSHGRNIDQLAVAASGECLIAEPATLAAADAIVLDQPLTPRNRPAYHTVHEAVTGERLSVYVRDGSGWRTSYQKTEVGGSDWFVPMTVGFLDRNIFGALMFGGGMVGFMTSTIIEPAPVDLATALAGWGLGERDATILSDGEMSAVAQKVLADPTIPHQSAAMQFLASYPWLNGWRTNDPDTVAAIIRDRRVTYFPGAPWNETTPPELAQPIVDRIVATDVDAPEPPISRGNRAAVRILAEVFSLLPPGSAGPLRQELMRLAMDKIRRKYAAAMLSRIADSGPSAIGDLEALIQTGLAEGRAANDKKAWASGDGCVVAIAVYGLARLGPDAKSAMPTVVAAIKDDLAKAYTHDELRNAGYLALLHMGELEALKTVRPLGADYSLKLLDRDARWEIGQCGIWS
jgi:hypothetical protein